VGGVWEVATWESAGGCVASTNTSRQCIQLVGGGYIQLIDRMSESGVPVHGWMAVVQGATAGAVYIPAGTQAAEMHRTFLPLVSGIGWGGPPPLPTEEEQMKQEEFKLWLRKGVVCGTCEGSGAVEVGDGDESILVTCSDCDGSGWIDPDPPPPPSEDVKGD